MCRLWTVALALILLGGSVAPVTGTVARPGAEAPGWRPVLLSRAARTALDASLRRVCDGLLSPHFSGIVMEPPRYRVEADGLGWRVALEPVRIRVGGLKAWRGEMSGRIDIEDMVVRYAPLAVGRLSLLSRPRARVRVDAAVDNLVEYLRARGVRDPYLRFPAGTGDIELGGGFGVGVMFMRFQPRVRIRGLWARHGRHHVFRLRDLYVSEAPGFVRAAVRTAIERFSRRGFGLDQGLAHLTDNGVEVVRVELRLHEKERERFRQVVEGG